MDLNTHLNCTEPFTVSAESFTQSNGLTGFNVYTLHQEEVIGSAKLYLAPAGLRQDTLLTYLDDIELLAVELFDIAQDQKRVAKQIESHSFAYLTDLKVHPNYQNHGVGSWILDEIVELLKTKHIPNLYLVSVADTTREQQKLHHFYTHHYFTYLMPQHPNKPGVMHRAID